MSERIFGDVPEEYGSFSLPVVYSPGNDGYDSGVISVLRGVVRGGMSDYEVMSAMGLEEGQLRLWLQNHEEFRIEWDRLAVQRKAHVLRDARELALHGGDGDWRGVMEYAKVVMGVSGPPKVLEVNVNIHADRESMLDIVSRALSRVEGDVIDVASE